MAAMDLRNPNLDDFVGLNWSCWVDGLNVLPPDAGSEAEDSSKYGRSCPETMTLRGEDMHIYGHCPAHDEIWLVVCNHCGQVVKPQAFEEHCERWHGPLPKMWSQSSALAPQQRPRPGRPPSNLSSSRDRQKDGTCHEASVSTSATLPVHQLRPTKTHKEAASFPSIETFPQENPPFPHHSCSTSGTSQHKMPPWLSGPLLPGHCSSSTSLSERPSVQKPTAGQFSDSQSPLQETRTYSRIYKNVDKKECNLNKQCRVVDPERKKLCTRDLICNTDSIHQQQKAMGRAKTFDQLAVEQRKASEGRDMAELLIKSKDKVQHMEAFEEKTTTQGSKYNSSNCHILRSRDPSESFVEAEGDSTVEVEVQPPYPFNQSLLSSEESEEDEQVEDTDLPAASWHPKPLGLCTFGCRTLGCSIFTFDRRWHHLRFALSAMLEQHVGAHLLKKMPQVSPGLMSRHVTSPAVGSPVKAGARTSRSIGCFTLESTSLEQLETKSSQHNTHSTKRPSSTTSASLGPGRWRSPVGWPSKAQVIGVELMQDASAAQKAAKLSQGGEDKFRQYVMHPVLHEKGQPHVPSSQGPVNGTFSHGKKPCPPRHPTPHSRGGPLRIQQKVVGCNHKRLAQKRKGSNESPPLSSLLSRTFKCQHFSSSFAPASSSERKKVPGTCLLGP